jgi:hypothetical protein
MTDETRQSPTQTVSHRDTEVCSYCQFCLIPSGFQICGHRHSEFYGDPVHPLGWCDRFKQLNTSHRPEEK